MRQFTHDLVSTLAEFVPRLLGAAVVLLVALVVALLLRRLTVRLLESLFERTGAANSLSRLGYEGSLSRLIGTVLFWGIMLTGVAGALGVLGLPSLESTMDQIINLSGRVLVALAILIAGVMSAGWLADLVAREAGRTPLEAARTPNMDRIAREGCQGLVRTVPDGFESGSDVATMTLLGYDPPSNPRPRCCRAPAPLPAHAQGVRTRAGRPRVPAPRPQRRASRCAAMRAAWRCTRASRC